MAGDSITPGLGASLVKILMDRASLPTLLYLDEGRQIVAYNCAWGRDFGSDWEHLSLNVSPEIENTNFEFVSTGEIVRATDPGSGLVLYHRTA